MLNWLKSKLRMLETRSSGAGYTSQVMQAREAQISGRSGLAELTTTVQSCVSLWQHGIAAADVDGTDLLTRLHMAMIARAVALRGEAVMLIGDRGVDTGGGLGRDNPRRPAPSLSPQHPRGGRREHHHGARARGAAPAHRGGSRHALGGHVAAAKIEPDRRDAARRRSGAGRDLRERAAWQHHSAPARRRGRGTPRTRARLSAGGAAPP